MNNQRPLDIPQDPDALLTTEQAASFLNYSVTTVIGWRSRGGGPKFVKQGARRVRYRRRDLIQWAEDRVVSSNTAARVAANG